MGMTTINNQNSTETRSMPNSVLNFREKSGYGAAELGAMSIEILVRLHLLKFYSDSVGLSPLWAGLAASLAIVWDAISDPLMGIISDKTRTKWGKRRPWILIGAVALALSSIAVFNPPVLQTQVSMFVYLLLTYLCLNTAMTMISVPHSALAAELTNDSNQRTVLFGFRLLFGNIGLLIGTALPAFMLSRSTNPLDSNNQLDTYGQAVYWLAAIVILSAAWTFRAVSHKDNKTTLEVLPNDSDKKIATKRTNLINQLKNILKNPMFFPLILAYFIASIGLTINSSLALYYYDYRLLLDARQTGTILVVFIAIICFALWFWVWISKEYGKKTPAVIGVSLLGIASCIAYPLFPPSSIVGPILMAIFTGFLAGSMVLLDSMVTDAIDYSEIKSGIRQEGLYFGFWKMAAKISRAFSIAIAGLILGISGWSSSQTEINLSGESIAWYFGPGTGIFLLIGAGILYYLPWDQKTNSRIQSILNTKQRKKQESQHSSLRVNS
jgi:GPH family glycoside/pentoside/hexuronide:cation symporter